MTDKNAIFTQLMLVFFAAAGLVLLQGAWQANSGPSATPHAAAQLTAIRLNQARPAGN